MVQVFMFKDETKYREFVVLGWDILYSSSGQTFLKRILEQPFFVRFQYALMDNQYAFISPGICYYCFSLNNYKQIVPSEDVKPLTSQFISCFWVT